MRTERFDAIVTLIVFALLIIMGGLGNYFIDGMGVL